MRNTKGQFTKGSGGRPKGAVNKNTKELREFVSNFLIENQDVVKEVFADLSPKDKVKHYIDLMQYALPKLKQVEAVSEFDNLSDEDLDRIIQYIEGKRDEQKR